MSVEPNERPAAARPGMTRRAFACLAGLAAAGGALRAAGARPCSAAEADGAAGLLASMTRRQKICQMLMPDLRQWRAADQEEPQDLVELNDEAAWLVESYGFGGVILFANNVKETRQTLALTDALQAAATRNSAGAPGAGIPLLLGIDQEGGIVYRLGSGCALPGNMALGATRSAACARGCGEVMGRELAALGINVDFAPVMDVNNNPNNPVIGLRSFSDRPELVAELGAAELEGIQARGVAATAKHFPGHGDAATDSHTGLPRIDKTRAELEELEFVPFRAAVEAGVDMVMTAHIQYPLVETGTAVSIDPEMGEIALPATLSHVFLTDILRGELGFDGVAVTDALNMDAIAANFAPADAARRAFLAGADIALMPVTLRSLDDVAALDGLLDKLEADPGLTDGRLDESVARILELKQRRGILPAGAGREEPFEDRLARALEEVGSEESRALEREAAASAVTVVRGEGLLPFRPSPGQRVLLVAAYENERPGMELAMRRLVAEGVVPDGVAWESVRYVEPDADAETVEAAVQELAGRVAEADFAVVVSEIGSTSRLSEREPSFTNAYVPARLAEAAAARGVPLAVMSISKPYDLALYRPGCALVAVYGNKGMDPTESLAPDFAFGPNVPAGVEVIFGGHAAQGKLPVDLCAVAAGPDGAPLIDTAQVVYPFGSGEEYPAVGAD